MTLTEAAIGTKHWLKIVGIFGAICLVLWLVFLFLYNNVYKPYAKSQVHAEARFGQIQKPHFPTSVVSSAGLKYSLDTASGALPGNFPILMNVYFIPPQETTLLAPDRAKKLAENLQFTSDPQILSANEYRYTDQYGGALKIELSTGNFSFKRNRPATLANGQPPATSPNLPEEQKVIDQFTSFIDGIGALNDNFKSPRGKVSYDNPNRLFANTAVVSLWPSNIGNYQVVTSDASIGPISATVTKYNDQIFKYDSVNYSVWSYDSQNLSSYPVKSVSQAYDELQKGQGTVIKKDTKNSQASITDVSLAYFLPADYQTYLQPIYVFQGNDFVAFVPALTDESFAK